MNDMFLHKQSLQLIATLLDARFDLEISECSFEHINTRLRSLTIELVERAIQGAS